MVERVDFDLKSLRKSVAPQFKEYDKAVEAADRRRARRAKIAITRRAIDEYKGILPNGARGLYLFAGETNDLLSLAYIGIAKGTLANRMEARFRDDTCLDEQQYGRSREYVWDTAYRRMCVSMASRPEQLIKYAFDHVKTMALFARADLLISFVTDDSDEAIKSAESLLIFSAVSAAAPLINIQERDKLSTNFAPGADLAMTVIEQAAIGAPHWSERADTLLKRFSGSCC